MRDAEVEGAAQDRAAVLQRAIVTEVLPQPERDRGELDAAGADAAIGHPLVAGRVGHEQGNRAPRIERHRHEYCTVRAWALR